jgi:DUF4097 and DUF4098 domain-containing protein YvlB
MSESTNKSLKLSTRSGKVHINAVPGAELSVDGGVMELGEGGVVKIHRAHDSKKIEVRCAPDTDVVVGTGSGAVVTTGRLGSVSVATTSGKIRVEEASRVDARTKSGSVAVDHCDEECRIVVVSGDVEIHEAAKVEIAAVSGKVSADYVRDGRIKTISGTIRVGTTGPGRVAVKSVSGTVEVAIPSEVRPSTRLHSVSGKVNCDCEPGSDGEISVATVSGTIRVSCR